MKLKIKNIFPIAVWLIAIGLIFWIQYNQKQNFSEALEDTIIAFSLLIGSLLFILLIAIIIFFIKWKKQK